MTNTKKVLIALGGAFLVTCVLGTIAVFFIQGVVEKAIDSFQDKEATAFSIVSYETSPDVKLIMALDITRVKMAMFSHAKSSQSLILFELSGTNKTSDEEFKNTFWDPELGKSDSLTAKAKALYARTKGIEDVKVLGKGSLRLKGGQEIPYIIADMKKDGKRHEGFMGVLNFPDSKKSVMIVDLAKPGEYRFELTRPFVETFGPPGPPPKKGSTAP